MPSTHVFHRHLLNTPPLATGGQGVYLTDAEGRQYLDASGGAAVSCLGHGHPDVLAAMHAQIDKLAYAHTSFFTTQVAEDLASNLIANAPEGMSHVYFVSGGSEAMEAAMKMARQYFVETGQPQRRHFIARRQSYHGNTLGAAPTGAGKTICLSGTAGEFLAHPDAKACVLAHRDELTAQNLSKFSRVAWRSPCNCKCSNLSIYPSR